MPRDAPGVVQSDGGTARASLPARERQRGPYSKSGAAAAVTRCVFVSDIPSCRPRRLTVVFLWVVLCVGGVPLLRGFPKKETI